MVAAQRRVPGATGFIAKVLAATRPWAGRARSCCCLLPALVRGQAWHLPCPTEPPVPAAVGTCCRKAPGVLGCGCRELCPVSAQPEELRRGSALRGYDEGLLVGTQWGSSGAGRAGTAASHPVPRPISDLLAAEQFFHVAVTAPEPAGHSQGPGAPLNHGLSAAEGVPEPAGAAGEGRSLPRQAGAVAGAESWADTGRAPGRTVATPPG